MNTYQLYRSYQREYLTLGEELSAVDQQITDLENRLLREIEELVADKRQEIEERLVELRQQKTDLEKRRLAAAKSMVKFSPV